MFIRSKNIPNNDSIDFIQSTIEFIYTAEVFGSSQHRFWSL